jgi:hypothetical protein
MQNLPPNLLREIVRRTGIRNRAALEATSRTMRQVSAEITKETRAALCRAIKVAFGMYQIMRPFTDAQRGDPQFQGVIEKAIGTYVSAAKAHDRGLSFYPRIDLKMTSESGPGRGERHVRLANLFVGYINRTRISVDAVIAGTYMHINVLTSPDGRRGASGSDFSSVSVFPDRAAPSRRLMVIIPTPSDNVRVLKRSLHNRRWAVLGEAERREMRLHMGRRVQEAQRKSALPKTIDLKVATRAIKACAVRYAATLK